MGLSYTALRNKFNSRPLVKPEDNLPPITGPTTGEASVNANAIPVPQRGSPVPVMDNSSMKVYKPDMQQVPGSMPNTRNTHFPTLSRRVADRAGIKAIGLRLVDSIKPPS